MRIWRRLHIPKTLIFMLFVVTSSLINSKFPYNKCSIHYLDHSFTLDSQNRKKSEEAITMIIRKCNTAIRVTYFMSSIYFAPGTARESEVCGSFCLNKMHRIFSSGYVQLRAVCYASGFWRISIHIAPRKEFCVLCANLAPKYVANLSYGHTTHIQILSS